MKIFHNYVECLFEFNKSFLLLLEFVYVNVDNHSAEDIRRQIFDTFKKVAVIYCKNTSFSIV